jgi:glycosyltransferase involved in cell wall biosynthesis
MNILFLMIAYPDIAENASMYTDLAQEFASKGRDVFVAVASGPNKTSFKAEGGIKVLRVRTLKMFNTSFLRKGIANILLPYQVIKGIKKYMTGIDFEAIILSTPPITYLRTVKSLRKKFNPKVYLILRDIFPQNARDLGILKNPVLYTYFRHQEKELYSIVHYIGCMSQGNIEYIITHNPKVPRNKLHLLPNWKKVTDYSPFNMGLKIKLGLKNKFVVLYGGNFGKPQQVDFVLELAIEMAVHEDVVFLFIGEGSEKKRIMDLATKKRLKNVKFEETLARDKYLEIVKFCNIGLVNLSDKFTIPNIPSRTLSYWEAKIPILASIDSNTDYCEILEQSRGGLWSITGDINSYKQNFEKLYQSKELRTSMGENGYTYLLENCTVSKAFSIINEKLIS